MTLHSFTPHHHEGSNGNDLQEKGVFGFLVEQFGDIFGQDLGEGHLEDFTYAQKTEDGLKEERITPAFLLSVFFISSLETQDKSSQSLAAFVPISEAVQSACLIAELPSRAPPISA